MRYVLLFFAYIWIFSRIYLCPDVWRSVINTLQLTTMRIHWRSTPKWIEVWCRITIGRKKTGVDNTTTRPTKTTMLSFVWPRCDDNHSIDSPMTATNTNMRRAPVWGLFYSPTRKNMIEHFLQTPCTVAYSRCRHINTWRREQYPIRVWHVSILGEIFFFISLFILLCSIDSVHGLQTTISAPNNDNRLGTRVF